MFQEETQFVFNTNALPTKVMTHTQYLAIKAQVIHDLTHEKLASKGRMAFDMRMPQEWIPDNVPIESRHGLGKVQFERIAANHFTGQFDERCARCEMCKLETMVDMDYSRMDYIARATVHCGATESHRGYACFDGYIPYSKKWTWNNELVPIHVSFDTTGEALSRNGGQFVKMTIVHDRPSMCDYRADPGIIPSIFDGTESHDEPQGTMARNNASSEYLTEAEYEMANEALDRKRTCLKASAPTPQPKTPCDDAW